eukprot:3944772-Pyramimonas_sp.AAC.1
MAEAVLRLHGPSAPLRVQDEGRIPFATRSPRKGTCRLYTRVVRIDTPDGYMVDTGRMSSNGIELYLNTLCHQSLTTGELKELKFGLQQPEDAYHWRSVSTRSRTPYVDCQHVVLARVSPQCFVDNH